MLSTERNFPLFPSEAELPLASTQLDRARGGGGAWMGPTTLEKFEKRVHREPLITKGKEMLGESKENPLRKKKIPVSL